jgi:hypothetical protein
VPTVSGSTSYDDRKQALLKQIPEPHQLISGWFDIVSRMLALGYTATDPCSWNRGYCLLPQNLVLDGGLCDINSLRQLSTIHHEGQRRHSIFETVQWLSTSVCYFLCGENAKSPHFNRNSLQAYAITLQNLQERLMTIRSEGVEIDGYVERILLDESSLMKQFESHIKGLPI